METADETAATDSPTRQTHGIARGMDFGSNASGKHVHSTAVPAGNHRLDCISAVYYLETKLVYA